MTRTKRSVLLTGLLLTIVFTLTGSAQLTRLDELMRQKLEHSQGLLEAVVLADHVTAERLANELIRLSDVSIWSPLQTPEYLHYAADFREAAKVLIAEAGARNIDGVSLAYMEMTLTCVQCHKHVRGARRAN
jgi:cytochrome c556